MYETWKAVVGYEGLYSVSDLGRVRRDAAGIRNAKAGRILTQSNRGHGYLRVDLYRSGTSKTYSVHSLVAAAFLGVRPVGHEIDHVDGNKANCASRNLEYVTRLENNQRAARLGLKPSGDRNGARTQPHRLARGENHWRRKLRVIAP